MAFRLAPGPGKYALAVVARASAASATHKLAVRVSINGRDVASYALSTEWSMMGAALEPGLLINGETTLNFTLEPSTNEAEAALVVESVRIGPRAESAVIAVGAPSPNAVLLDGFYGAEGDGPAAECWSAGSRTRVGFLLEPAKTPYNLVIDGAAFAPLRPLPVDVLVNATKVGTLSIDAGPRSVLTVPPALWRSGVNDVELAYPRTMKPRDANSKSQDARDIALRIRRLAVEPVSR